jgi:hypothetical protein
MKNQYMEDLKNKRLGSIKPLASSSQSLTQAPLSKGLGFGGLFSTMSTETQLNKAKANELAGRLSVPLTSAMLQMHSNQDVYNALMQKALESGKT